MPHTCLIAANDPWFIQLLRIYAQECGLRVVQAYESQDVESVIHLEQPEVILMQGGLPGNIPMSEMLHAIQSHALTRHIPVLLFSWQGQVIGEEAQAAVTHLQEPITYQAFLAALVQAGVTGLSIPVQPPAVGTSDPANSGKAIKTPRRRKAK